MQTLQSMLISSGFHYDLDRFLSFLFVLSVKTADTSDRLRQWVGSSNMTKNKNIIISARDIVTRGWRSWPRNVDTAIPGISAVWLKVKFSLGWWNSGSGKSVWAKTFTELTWKEMSRVASGSGIKQEVWVKTLFIGAKIATIFKIYDQSWPSKTLSLQPNCWSRVVPRKSAKKLKLAIDYMDRLVFWCWKTFQWVSPILWWGCQRHRYCHCNGVIRILLILCDEQLPLDVTISSSNHHFLEKSLKKEEFFSDFHYPWP